MIIEVNNILIKNSFNKPELVLGFNSLDVFNKSKKEKISEVESKIPSLINLPFILESYLKTLLETKELNTLVSLTAPSNPFSSYTEQVTIIDVVEDDDGEEVEEEIIEEVQTEIFSEYIPVGWSIMSVPLDLTNIIMTHSYMDGKNEGDVVDFTELGMDKFIQNHLYQFENDTQPLFYKDLDFYIANTKILKNNSGEVYLPEWEFNGIGNISQFEGYQIKLVHLGSFLKIKAIQSDNINKLSLTNETYNNGWYMVGFKSMSTTVTVKDYVIDYVNEDQLVIVKDEYGHVYMPEYDFNGIGNMIPGKGYQVKFKNM